MRTVADPSVLGSLVARLRGLRPEARRRWGTLTPHEMLGHLADATDMVLRTRPRPRPLAGRGRSVVKLLVLWSPLRWPHGWPSNPMLDPKAGGTRPSVFARDLARVVAGLDRMA